MGWFNKTFTSSIGRKLVMSLTGIFLILILIEHLIGNLLLLKEDGGVAFNEFAHFMKYNPLIQIGEVVLFGGFIFHAFDGLLLERKNRVARPVKYAFSNKSKLDSVFSKYMGPFGIVILIFLVIHLWNFFRFKYFADVAHMEVDGEHIADLAGLTVIAFQDPITVAFYVIAMIPLAFHLNHGFQSAFQTLGINHKKYSPTIRFLGAAYSVIIPLGMALIPLIMYIKHISN